MGLDNGLDSRGLPVEEGVYLVSNFWGLGSDREVDVYEHPVKGLCCFSEDIGSEGTGVDYRYDCHVSVQMTGLDFVKRMRGFDEKFL